MGVPLPKPLHPLVRQRGLSHCISLSVYLTSPCSLLHLVTAICGLAYFLCVWLEQYVHFALRDYYFFAQNIKVGHSFSYFFLKPKEYV